MTSPHADRLFPVQPEVRNVARRLYGHTRHLPILSPHGHIPPQWLAEDTPFTDPASLFIVPDHYVFRMLHAAAGIDLRDLGVGQGELDEEASRKSWRLLCEHFHLFRGTPVRYWLESELADVFGITETLSAGNADATYDTIAEALTTPALRPRALLARFQISTLATTDDPVDDLRYHRAIAQDPTFRGRVIPTFRPDKYLEPAQPGFAADMRRLAEAANIDTGTYGGYIAALENRRRYFAEYGAVSSDHSHYDLGTHPLPEAEAAHIYDAALRGEVSHEEATAFRRHMVGEMARMACDDGLVMTLHPAVRRNHHPATFKAFGADKGADIPVRVEVTESLRPLLSRYGTQPGFQLIVFTLDETIWSRELAPLAGFYPSVYAGVPWWFLDAPAAITRFRGAVTETAGFYKTSGFVDDTRAFLSIPARHDMSRRLDAAYLAGLVTQHQLTEEDAAETAVDLVTTIPEKAFKL